MAERVLLESADGLTKEFVSDYEAYIITTTFLEKISRDDSAGVYRMRRYEYLEKRNGMKVYKEIVD